MYQIDGDFRKAGKLAFGAMGRNEQQKTLNVGDNPNRDRSDPVLAFDRSVLRCILIN